MISSTLRVALFVASIASTAAQVDISNGTTEAVASSIDHVKFSKQWTLSSTTSMNLIDTIRLNLTGRVFVSHKDGLDSGVLGYVTVSGDSETIVDSVTMNSVVIGDLQVSNSSTLDGYLLTEIYLASSGQVTYLDSVQPAEVIVEEDVLRTDNETALMLYALMGTSLFVNIPSTAVTVLNLTMQAWENSTLQLNAESVETPSGSTYLYATGGSTLSVFESSFDTGLTNFQAEVYSDICVSGGVITAYGGGVFSKDADSNISMPDATGETSSECTNSTVPAREAALVSVDGAESSFSGSAGGSSTGSGDTSSAESSMAFRSGAALVVALAVVLSLF